MTRKRKSQLPAEGAAFAVPLADGRFSACRIIQGPHSPQAKLWCSKCVLVACSAWIGDGIPAVDNPLVRQILRLTHLSWSGKLELLWISDPVPDTFIPIGSIEPTPEELAIECGTLGTWASMSIQPLAQWRWDNERASVLQEDMAKSLAEADRRAALRRQRGEYLSQVTLESLRNHHFFPNWTKYPPPRATKLSREIMATAVDRLLELGPSSNEADRIAVLRACIESFNELDATLSFIETVEREDICEEFEALVHASGLGAHEYLADQWRDW